MASSEVSIDQLPVVSQIVNGDFIIVQSPNATSKLDFKNFVIGTDNTTFKSAITPCLSCFDSILIHISK